MTNDKNPILRDIYDLASRMDTKIDNLRMEVSNHYVTRVEFEPVRKIVFSLVGMILVTVVGAILAIVLKQS